MQLTNEVRVRDATEADLCEIAEIYNHAILNSSATFDVTTKTVDQWRRLLSYCSEEYPLIVAVTEGRVVGWGMLKPFIDRPAARFTTENAVYVDPNCGGKGIGTALMEELIQRARKNGYHAIIAMVVDGNAASERLHEKVGFQRAGLMREVGHKFDQWLDLIVFELIL
jgi:L-amino acid N-acyltransferase